MKKYRIYIRFNKKIKSFKTDVLEPSVSNVVLESSVPLPFTSLSTDQFSRWLRENGISSQKDYDRWFREQDPITQGTQKFRIGKIDGREYYLPTLDSINYRVRVNKDPIYIALKNCISPVVDVELNEEQVKDYLEKLSETAFKDKVISRKSLDKYFTIEGNYTNIIFGLYQAKGINYEGTIYPWPSELQIPKREDIQDRKRQEYFQNILKWIDEWIAAKYNYNSFEILPNLYDQNEDIIIGVFKEIIKDMKIRGYATTTRDFEIYRATHLLKANTPVEKRALPYYPYNGVNYKVIALRYLRNMNKLSRLNNGKDMPITIYDKIEDLFRVGYRQELGAGPYISKKLNDLENQFQGYKFIPEYKMIRNPQFKDWIENTLHYEFKNGQYYINSFHILKFFKEQGINTFSLSNYGDIRDNFSVYFDENNPSLQVNIAITRPYKGIPKSPTKLIENLNHIRVNPNKYSIDLLVVKPNNEKIAIEADGEYHYGLSGHNTNFLADFVNDQLQKYFLENVIGWKLLRIPYYKLRQTPQKRFEELIEIIKKSI